MVTAAPALAFSLSFWLRRSAVWDMHRCICSATEVRKATPSLRAALAKCSQRQACKVRYARHTLCRAQSAPECSERLAHGAHTHICWLKVVAEVSARLHARGTHAIQGPLNCMLTVLSSDEPHVPDT